MLYPRYRNHTTNLIFMANLQELRTRLLAAADLYKSIKATQLAFFAQQRDTLDPDLETLLKKCVDIQLLPANILSMKSLEDVANFIFKEASAPSIDFSKIDIFTFEAEYRAVWDKAYNMQGKTTGYTDQIYGYISSLCNTIHAQFPPYKASAVPPLWEAIQSNLSQIPTIYAKLPPALQNTNLSNDGILQAFDTLSNDEINACKALLFVANCESCAILKALNNATYIASFDALTQEPALSKLRLGSHIEKMRYLFRIQSLDSEIHFLVTKTPCPEALQTVVQAIVKDTAFDALIGEIALATAPPSDVATLAAWRAAANKFITMWKDVADLAPAAKNSRCGQQVERQTYRYQTIQQINWNVWEWETSIRSTTQPYIDAMQQARTAAKQALQNYSNLMPVPEQDIPLLQNLAAAIAALIPQLTNIDTKGQSANNELVRIINNIHAQKEECDKALQRAQAAQSVKNRISEENGRKVLQSAKLALPNTADYEWLDVSSPSSFPLYLAGNNDKNVVVTSKDIQQAGLGDCYYLATAAALASQKHALFKPNDGIIKAVMKDGMVSYFTVELYMPVGAPLDGKASYEKVLVKVAPQLVRQKNKDPNDSTQNLPYHQFGDTIGNTSEIWGAVLEMALVQAKGGFDEAKSGDAREAFAMLTGKSGTKYTAPFDEATLDKVVAALHKCDAAVFSTVDAASLEKDKKDKFPAGNKTNDGDRFLFEDGLELFANHSYTFSKIQGKKIELLNPHMGSLADKLQTVAISDLNKYFTSITIYMP